MRTMIFFYLLIFRVVLAFGQSPSDRAAVRLFATVDSVQPAITVQWSPYSGASSYTIYRRAAGETVWGAALATLPSSSVAYTDNAVTPGLAYEYKVVRSAMGTGYGYLRSGIAVPPVEDRGILLLLVESGVAQQLVTELIGLETDLLADGWWVVRHDVAATASPTDVRDLVIAEHAADPRVAAVYLLGHVPVPYSGNTNPDGHSEHRGAWPCDGYYGELDGNWTDITVSNTSGSYQRNHNVPGDGKFDQSDFPSPVELQVGRVDMSDLPAYGMNEVQLLQTYLFKSHRWKTREYVVPVSAVVFDDLQWVMNPLASSGYQSLSTCVGGAALTDQPPSTGPFIDIVANNTYLWTYHGGAGLIGSGTNQQATFIGTTNGITTAGAAAQNVGGVFNMSFGSYYGDWDNEDNFLRGLLGSGNVLSHVWSGVPNWFFHPMGMGEPIGHCALRSMNNTNQDFSLQNGGWQGQSMGRSHMALMGDPSLRLQYLAPPSDPVVTNAGWYTAFSWSPSTEAVYGYLIYRLDSVTRSFERITPDPVTDTTYVSTVPFVPGHRYMVRALKLVTTASGSYHDLSLGAMALAQGTQLPDCEGVIGGPALPGSPCDDDDPLTANDVYDTQCLCAGIVNSVGAIASPNLQFLQNAAMQQLTVRADQELFGTYRILNMQGALVDSGNVRGGSLVLDLGAMSSGTYLFQYLPERSGMVQLTGRFAVVR